MSQEMDKNIGNVNIFLRCVGKMAKKTLCEAKMALIILSMGAAILKRKSVRSLRWEDYDSFIDFYFKNSITMQSNTP